MPYNNEKERKTNTSTPVPRRDDGQVGIRATLNNMGFSNDRIDYDQTNGTVTLDNRTLIKPGYLDDDAGVSYASVGDIRKSLVNLYQGSNNPIVRVSDAYAGTAGKYGLSADALTYGNGTVSVGGVPLDVLYIDDDGKAWTWQNRVDDAVRDYASNLNLQSPSALAKNYESRYLRGAENLASQLRNRKDFSYQPENDPVYQAYRNKYMLEGDRASRNAMANYAALTGGYVNSAAATAGAQASQYYAQQLTDKIPELAQQAYQRYADRYQRELNLLNSMVDMYDTAYQNANAANNAQRDNANASAASNTARDDASYTRNRQDRLDQQAYEQSVWEQNWANHFNWQTAEKNDLTNAGLRLSNQEMELAAKYYERLTQAELANTRANTELTQARTYQIYNK